MIQGFIRGFFAPFQGMGFIKRHPSTWKYVVIPVLINLLYYSLPFLSIQPVENPLDTSFIHLTHGNIVSFSSRVNHDPHYGLFL